MSHEAVLDHTWSVARGLRGPPKRRAATASEKHAAVPNPPRGRPDDGPSGSRGGGRFGDLGLDPGVGAEAGGPDCGWRSGGRHWLGDGVRRQTCRRVNGNRRPPPRFGRAWRRRPLGRGSGGGEAEFLLSGWQQVSGSQAGRMR